MNTTQFAWLASYPKSGNTWVRLMLSSLLHGGKEPDINAMDLSASILSHAHLQSCYGVESGDLMPTEIDAVRPQLYRALAESSNEKLLLSKVHDCCGINAAGERYFSPEISRGAVCIVRDPRDVAVSWSHFFGTSVDKAIEVMADENTTLAGTGKRLHTQLSQHLSSWSKHVLSWLDDAAMPVLLLRYEDMLVDPIGALVKIADFLGLPSDCAAAAAEATSFEKLRSQEDQHGFKERTNVCDKFFRKGTSGEGKRVLTEEQRARIESDHGRVMARLGY